ncbi:MAG: PadR family transcriptional regulator [Roseburia sp.]|nr:PadR family transcriptional regulator [Roseburia sp.]
MNLDKWKSQIARGTLEYCVLLMLSQKTCYGYEILQELNKYPMLASTESTVYPLLRRLLKENYLESVWKDSAEGLPPRKYYSLTPLGQEYIELMSKEWENLLQAIEGLKGERL